MWGECPIYLYIIFNILDKQRTDCLLEMREAMELVDKMRKKQSSIVNSLKLATGATSGTDDIDTKIFSLKARMEKIKQGIEELVQRWMKIESLCGFSITGPFGRGIFFSFFWYFRVFYRHFPFYRI